MEERRIAITTVETREKAELLKKILEPHGIEAVLSLNEKVQILGEVSEDNQPHDVRVRMDQAEEALNILQTSKTQELSGTERTFDITVIFCSRCNERILLKKSLKDLLSKCPKCLADL